MTNYLWSLYGEKKAVQMIAEAGFDAVDWSIYDANVPGSIVRKENYREVKRRSIMKMCSITRVFSPVQRTTESFFVRKICGSGTMPVIR